jgi:hypothetical protein
MDQDDVSSLNPEDFAEDVSVRVECAGEEIWLSERLFRRLVWIGQAYEFHLLPVLGEDRTLNAVQAQALAAELGFVGAIVRDKALESLLTLLLQLVTASIQAGAEISVEWP